LFTRKLRDLKITSFAADSRHRRRRRVHTYMRFHLYIACNECARAPIVIIIRSASIITHARSKIQQGRRRVGGEPNNSSSSISILTKRPAANPSRENILLQFPFRFSSFTIYIFLCVCATLCQCLCIRPRYLAPKYIKVGFFTLNLLDRCRPAYRFRISLFFGGSVLYLLLKRSPETRWTFIKRFRLAII